MERFWCDKCFKEAIDKSPCDCETTYHRERLNPEDAWIKTAIIDELFDDNGNLKSVCESPNCDNK